MPTYTVVPFIGHIQGAPDPKKVAAVSQQLQELINTYAAQGYEFVEVAHITVEVAPGCLGKFLGQGPTYTSLDQVVFRK